MSDDYERRLTNALTALAEAVPVREIPVSPRRPAASTKVVSRSTQLSAGLVSAVAVTLGLVLTLRVLAPSSSSGLPFDTSSTSAQPSAAASPGTEESGTNLRYDDGIPETWDGLPVYRGQAALDKADASVDRTPFLVAFWVGPSLPTFCGSVGPNENALYLCGAMTNVGDRPGVVSTTLGAALRVDTTATAAGPVIVRVHTHDERVADCPDLYAKSCQRLMFGEAIMWHGDSATAPNPISLDQAAEAFGIDATASALTCSSEGLPGVVPLAYTPQPAEAPEAVVLVFPSTAALALAAPQAATSGGSDTPPLGHQTCNHTGTDPVRGSGLFSLSVRWIAYENLLVAVQYDTALGADRDPVVRDVRARLSSLQGLTRPAATN